MKIAVVTNNSISNTPKVLSDVESSLNNVGLDYDVMNVDDLKRGYDFVCAIGGDGTILKASRYYSVDSTPVMGVNLGRLGFLSLIPPASANEVGKIIKEETFCLRERIMLESNGKTALNDIVIKGHSSARTSEFDLYINDRLVSDYIADGIIISTPTGSTAYGLSAGGPIIHPGLDAMVVVPICAHTMTARPLVIPAKEHISVKAANETLDVTFDGQVTLKELKEVNIVRCEDKATLAFPQDYKFYSVLRNKLHWGISPIS